MVFFSVLLLSVMLLTGCGREPVIYYSLEASDTSAAAGTESGPGTSGTPVSPEAAPAADSPGTDAGTAGAKKAAPGGTGTGADAEEAAPGSAGEAADAAGEAGPAGETAEIAVFVCGAVLRPGVYELPGGARAVEGVEAAGGFLPDADTDYINLAEPLQDGMKLYIYTEEETAALPAAGPPASAESVSGTSGAGTEEARVNLNTAGKEELMTLSGIGEARAAAIIAWREDHGGFSDIAQIKEISGIGDSLYSKIRDHITVG